MKKLETLKVQKDEAVSKEEYDVASVLKKEIMAVENNITQRNSDIEQLKADIETETVAIKKREEEKRKREEEERRKREEEERRRQEEERRAREEEERRKRDEERRTREEEQQRKREEEQRRKQEAEERKRLEEEKKKREESDKPQPEVSNRKKITSVRDDLLDKYRKKKDELTQLKAQCALSEDYDGALNYKMQLDELEKKYSYLLQAPTQDESPALMQQTAQQLSMPPTPTSARGDPQHAKVRWNFTPLSSAATSGETDIAVKEGDLCKVVRAPKNGWVKVEINGVVGLVPERYLIPLRKPMDQ